MIRASWNIYRIKIGVFGGDKQSACFRAFGLSNCPDRNGQSRLLFLESKINFDLCCQIAISLFLSVSPAGINKQKPTVVFSGRGWNSMRLRCWGIVKHPLEWYNWINYINQNEARNDVKYLIVLLFTVTFFVNGCSSLLDARYVTQEGKESPFKPNVTTHEPIQAPSLRD